MKIFGAPLGKGLIFATRIAKAFCHHKADAAAREVEYLECALRAGTIVGMQEVHGSAARMPALIDHTGLDY